MNIQLLVITIFIIKLLTILSVIGLSDVNNTVNINESLSIGANNYSKNGSNLVVEEADEDEDRNLTLSEDSIMSNVFNKSGIQGLTDAFSFTGKNDDEIQSECSLLNSNNSLAQLIPGWEGIPINIAINFVVGFLLLVAFGIIRRWVIVTEKDMSNHGFKRALKTNWLHFIYGNKKYNDNIYYSMRHINRNHPKAYLPLVLHGYDMKGNDFDDDDETTVSPEVPLFMTSIHSQQSMNNSDIKTETNHKKQDCPTSPVSNESNPGKTLQRTKSELEIANDQLKIARLKSVLNSDLKNEEDMTSNLINSDKTAKTFKQWIVKYLLIKDIDILNKRGSDAIQYLVFQRFIIYYLTFMTIICLTIIMPFNLDGSRLDNKDNLYYRKTTTLNIEQNSSMIWIHALMTIMIVIMGFYLMNNFEEMIVNEKDLNVDNRVVLIENIPEEKRDVNLLKKFLLQKFQTVTIIRITFIYDTSKVMSMMTQMLTTMEAKSYCKYYLKQYGQRCEVRPYTLGNFLGIFCCCLCFPKVDGIEYYRKQREELDEQITTELEVTASHPTRMAFVIFANENNAKKVYDTYHRYLPYSISKLIQWIRGPPKDDFNSWTWIVSYAPSPDDIDWNQIVVSPMKVCLSTIIFNLLIVLVFLFLSTPNSLINMIKLLPSINQTLVEEMDNQDNDQNENVDKVSILLSSYLPTMVMLICSSVSPLFIKIFNQFIPCRTKSDYNYQIFYKFYIFLVFMVLILPSLSNLTLYAILKSWVAVRRLSWHCIFPTDNGPFFLNYVVASALVGNAMELTRIPELAMYIVNMLFVSRTPAEYLAARQDIRFEFFFGIFYPKILLMIAIVNTYCISNPFIAPFGLIYIIIKHLADRYLLYHVYASSPINQRMHRSAVFFLKSSLGYLLFQVYFNLNGKTNKNPSFVILIALILHLCYVIFKGLSLIICS